MRFFETDGWGGSAGSQAGNVQPAVAQLRQHQRLGRVSSGRPLGSAPLPSFACNFSSGKKKVTSIWEMKHLSRIPSRLAGIIYFGEKGEGKE